MSQSAGPGPVVVVRPWPFAAKELVVSSETQELHQLQFQDDADLALALHQALIAPLSWPLRMG